MPAEVGKSLCLSSYTTVISTHEIRSAGYGEVKIKSNRCKDKSTGNQHLTSESALSSYLIVVLVCPIRELKTAIAYFPSANELRRCTSREYWRGMRFAQ